jgi:hypothetical protein
MVKGTRLLKEELQLMVEAVEKKTNSRGRDHA